MFVRIIVIVALLVLGIVFAVVGLRSRPHKLKKNFVRITFRKNLPHEPGELLAVINSTKTELLAAAIWFAILVFVTFLLLSGNGSFLYILSSAVGTFYNLRIGTRKLLLFDNAIVVQTITGRKVYWLDEITCIESYNIVNSFNRGVSYGYRLSQNENTLLELPAGAFKEFAGLEEVYRHSAYIEDFFEADSETGSIVNQ